MKTGDADGEERIDIGERRDFIYRAPAALSYYNQET
jgi:hypothetical protein